MKKLLIIVGMSFLVSCAKTGVVEVVVRANTNQIKGDVQVKDLKDNKITTIKNTNLFIGSKKNEERLNKAYVVKFNKHKVIKIVSKPAKK
jgi:hypothetical protein